MSSVGKALRAVGAACLLRILGNEIEAQLGLLPEKMNERARARTAPVTSPHSMSD
jgi:hypothetical protein